MSPLRMLSMLAFAVPAAPVAAPIQVDRYFAVQPVEGGLAHSEFVVRISETARARAFAEAARHGRPMRLTSRIVPRPAVWNLAWPFYTERHRLIGIETLVARCSSRGPADVAVLIEGGAKLQGSAWCPAVRVVREITPQPSA